MVWTLIQEEFVEQWSVRRICKTNLNYYVNLSMHAIRLDKTWMKIVRAVGWKRLKVFRRDVCQASKNEGSWLLRTMEELIKCHERTFIYSLPSSEILTDQSSSVTKTLFTVISIIFICKFFKVTQILICCISFTKLVHC